MLFSTALFAIAATSLATAAPAPHELLKRQNGTNSSSVPAFYARSEVRSDLYGIEAHFEFWGFTDGTGTFVKVNVLKGLLNTTAYNGPFLYHVHTNPVGQGGNCTVALGHLDPLNVTESLTCDPAYPAYCQEGDLSGKHGVLNATSTGAIGSFGYTDDFLRFFPADFSILGRSIVIHAPNKTRLACGDIISTLDGTADLNYSPTNNFSNFVTNYPSAPPYNPPSVVTPIVGLTFPDNSTIQNLPFPLPNPAIALQQSLNVQLGMMNRTVYVNGTQVNATLPYEAATSDKAPLSPNLYVWP